ncbi:TBC1 domain family member 19-like [Belonocnema kinseyi]|uniref:TBC1 domain family member 19-like n=1 Tax=Belonocnema kinseyi TaxID=2817044 RepID=UPI00143DFD43|nr:TBC1 domain family member 19-like [Belonocnema kinseyi]XP_033210829.1 TBC1 domain family member 19-like [Belonocnema kinseyi]
MERKEDLDKCARKLEKDIQNIGNYKSLYNKIQKLVASPAVKNEDFKKALLDALQSNCLETELRNTMFHWSRSEGPLQPKEKPPIADADLSYLKKAQVQWERRIQKSLNSMCNELNVPLARIRPNSEKEDLSDKWEELSTYDIDLSQYRPLYAPKDFLEVLFSVRDPSFRKQQNEPNWEFSHIQIRVKTLAELRSTYVELSEGAPLLGVNPNMASVGGFPSLEAERTHLGEQVLKSNQSLLSQEFLKLGSPIALRGQLWSLVLGSIVKANDIEYYKELKGIVSQYDIMVDKLIIKV